MGKDMLHAKPPMPRRAPRRLTMTRAEARFWAGIAALKLDGTKDRSILHPERRVIAEEHADTPWLVRAAASWGEASMSGHSVTPAA
jgi:hypothetical protein